MENTSTPTALILSRQNIKDIPAQPGSTRYADALQSEKGAYAAWKNTAENPDIILLANGSEVSTCIEGAEKLASEKNLKVWVVAAPSEGLFRLQPVEYQKSVIPDDIPVLGLTAGLPVTLQGLAGPAGKVIGMESFGFSAPFKVLDEKLGYTGENVFNKAIEMLQLK